MIQKLNPFSYFISIVLLYITLPIQPKSMQETDVFFDREFEIGAQSTTQNPHAR